MTNTTMKMHETREQLTNALKRLDLGDREGTTQTERRELLESVALDAKLALRAIEAPVDENVIDRATIARVYSGRPGCGCGCRGNYSTNPATITRVVNKMNARSEEVKRSETFGDHWVYALEDDDRANWAYTYDDEPASGPSCAECGDLLTVEQASHALCGLCERGTTDGEG